MFADQAPQAPSPGFTHAALHSDVQDQLLTEVDFKWLLAGQGLWVDPARLHSDARYTEHILRSALASPSRALRVCAAQLARQLDAVMPR